LQFHLFSTTFHFHQTNFISENKIKGNLLSAQNASTPTMLKYIKTLLLKNVWMIINSPSPKYWGISPMCLYIFILVILLILIWVVTRFSMERKTISHYSCSQKILLVGEGDFSFSLCLARAFGTATNMVATSLDSRGTFWTILKFKHCICDACKFAYMIYNTFCWLIHLF